ncbi:Copper-sensing two-component system response regulator CpxR [Pseudomonas syringae pv. tagetis]|uniref:Copper-sensing two-component system response regulator CpxR n=1 Tax=Pseudomonas syringae pv. tagetis TaxID=129140 RepID=A0A0Q0ESC6_9PSED|nr:Copper-sensing two-component system response regulator CpxR [Pseudomonas syringae pv. tagetis]
MTCTNSAEEGEIEALSGRHDIVVLDIMMPRMSGIEVLRRIRAQSQVPVILLTARGDNIDRISGLELGADDYVPKPSSPGELVARLRAIMRRVRAVPMVETGRDVVQAGELTLWPGKREAHWQGVTLN